MAVTVCFEIQCGGLLTLFRLPIPDLNLNAITPKTTPKPCHSDPCPECTDLGLCEGDVHDQEGVEAYFYISACVLGNGVEASLPTFSERSVGPWFSAALPALQLRLRLCLLRWMGD